MAIAKAGQSAYSEWGEEAILTEEFLAKDYKTWESGKVSINHENNNDLLGKATICDIEFEAETGLVWATFPDLPEKALDLINSDFYEGLSQECIPLEYSSWNKVVKGYGLGVTIVTYPYTPAATQAQGVGVRPATSINVLTAILSSKYPTQKEDTMPNNGDGRPVISIETYEKAVSERDELRSKNTALESQMKTKDDEIGAWKQKFADLESSSAKGIESSYKKGFEDGGAARDAETERFAAIKEFTDAHGEDYAQTILATNPSLETIRVLTASKKTEVGNRIGSGQYNQGPDGMPKTCTSRRWDPIKQDWVEEWS